MSLTENVNRILKARKDSLTRITEKDADCKSEIEAVGIDNLRWKDVSGYIDKIKKYTGKSVEFNEIVLRTTNYIVLPDGIDSLRDYLFSNCRQLWSVTIPTSVKKIGGYVFNSCIAFSDIKYLGTKEEWDAIEKSPNWKDNITSNKNPKLICTDGTYEISSL